MKTGIRQILVLFGIATATRVSAVQSAPVLVDATSRYRHWSTVCTNEVPLRWNWATNATRATLNIAGMTGTLTTNLATTVSNWIWTASASDVPDAEDVYTLTLTFYRADDVAVGAMTSRLAVVKGGFGPASVDAVTSSRSWTRVKTDTVLAYDAKWGESPTHASSTTLRVVKVGGAVASTDFADTAGYYGWKLRNSGWGYGVFDWSLIFGGMTNEWAATLQRPQDGTAVGIR